VVVMGAGLRATGKAAESPPYPTITRAPHFYPDSVIRSPTIVFLDAFVPEDGGSMGLLPQEPNLDPAIWDRYNVRERLGVRRELNKGCNAVGDRYARPPSASTLDPAYP